MNPLILTVMPHILSLEWYCLALCLHFYLYGFKFRVGCIIIFKNKYSDVY